MRYALPMRTWPVPFWARNAARWLKTSHFAKRVSSLVAIAAIAVLSAIVPNAAQRPIPIRALAWVAWLIRRAPYGDAGKPQGGL